MNDCLFCRIIAGEIPGVRRSPGRASGRVQGHQPAGAAPRADRPAPAHRHAQRSRPADDALVGSMQRCAAMLANSTDTPSAATARCSTPTAKRARRCSTSICTCSPAWIGLAAGLISAATSRILTSGATLYRTSTSRSGVASRNLPAEHRCGRGSIELLTTSPFLGSPDVVLTPRPSSPLTSLQRLRLMRTPRVLSTAGSQL